MTGQIKTGTTEYTVECFMCQAVAVEHQFQKWRAEDEFGEAGWRQIGGVWACPAHERVEVLAELRKRRAANGS